MGFKNGHTPAHSGKGQCFAWLQAHINYQGDDCLVWPFFREKRVGRGKLGYKGKMYWAHRLMCEMVHGAAPTPQHQATHTCGKGHYGCVNPRHLEWGTNSKNQIDRWQKNGSRLGNHGGPKGHLSPEQQAAIIALKGKKLRSRSPSSSACRLAAFSIGTNTVICGWPAKPPHR